MTVLKPGKRKVNLEDVARLAGVSIVTVSRSLSDPKKVRPATLKRVQDAVAKLGYVAHGAARALASRRTRTIGVVIPSLENAIFANTVFALQRTLDENGYMLLVACDEYDLKVEVRLVHNLIERGVDGLILVGTLHNPEIFAMLHAFQVPYVFTWAYDETRRSPCVGFNHRQAAARAAQHLIDLGHREFGVISTITRDNERARDRLAGVLETLAHNNIRPDSSRIVEEPFSYVRGQKGFRQIMVGPQRPTAVVCLNDVLAIGAMAECRAMGMEVPRDVSITGCEDLEVAAMMAPGLTTVRFPTFEMGRCAGTYLLGTLRGEPVSEQQVFETELIVRGSTARPRDRG